ncbi:MAG: apolipoprotein N-acyltransferase [Deltaproteobacteria bacterium]|nr:apolipoprotein N-acyltransferase [Deltaproteobacteria bacterium]
MTRTIFLSILSGAMLIAAFPPIDIGFFAWVGMVPFFFALSDTAVGSQGAGVRKGAGISLPKFCKRGFLLGLLWGIIFFLGTVYWVVNSMVNYGGVPFFTSILVLLLLVLYLALFFAAFGFGTSIVLSIKTNLLLKVLFTSSLWVGLEYIRTNMITIGFPWVLLGYSQSSLLPIIQITDITGVYGVSFLIVMVNMFIFLAIQAKSSKLKEDKELSTVSFQLSPFLKSGFVVSFILIIVLIYGFFRIYETDKISQNWKTLKIGIAQGNIDQGRKWDISFKKETVDIYKNLNMALAKQGVRLIIWPETAIPFYLQSDKELGPEVFNLPREANAYLFTGNDAYGLGFDGEVKYYNSAFLISPKGELVGKYDKIHLVPFGEYVPLKNYLPFIHKLVVGVGDFSSGKWLKPLELDGDSFGVLICFESIFPELARGFINEGAGFLVNITNDAWFGRTSAPYQHFSQAVFRAVENKVFLIRAANTGVSGVIDPVGRIILKSDIFTREAMAGYIKIKDINQFTFYSRYGDIFAIGCMIIVAGYGLWVLGLNRSKNK